MYLAAQRLLLNSDKNSDAPVFGGLCNWSKWNGGTDGPTFSYLALPNYQNLDVTRAVPVSLEDFYLGSLVGDTITGAFYKAPRLREATLPAGKTNLQELYKSKEQFPAASNYQPLFLAQPVYLPVSLERMTQQTRATFLGNLQQVRNEYQLDIISLVPGQFSTERQALAVSRDNPQPLDTWVDCFAWSPQMPFGLSVVPSANYQTLQLGVYDFVNRTSSLITLGNTALGLAATQVFGSASNSGYGAVVLSSDEALLLFRNASTNINYGALLRIVRSAGAPPQLNVVKIKALDSKINPFVGMQHGKRINNTVSLVRIGTTVHLIQRGVNDFTVSSALQDSHLNAANYADNTYFASIDDSSFIIYDEQTRQHLKYYYRPTSSPPVGLTTKAEEIIANVTRGDFIPYSTAGAGGNPLRQETVFTVTQSPSGTERIFDEVSQAYVMAPRITYTLTSEVRLYTFLQPTDYRWRRQSVDQVSVAAPTSTLKQINQSDFLYANSNRALALVNRGGLTQFVELEVSVAQDKGIVFQPLQTKLPFAVSTPWFGSASGTINEALLQQTLSQATTLSKTPGNVDTSTSNNGAVLFGSLADRYYGYYLTWGSAGTVNFNLLPQYPVNLRLLGTAWRNTSRFYSLYYTNNTVWLGRYWHNPQKSRQQQLHTYSTTPDADAQTYGEVVALSDSSVAVIYARDNSTLRFQLYTISANEETLTKIAEYDFAGMKPRLLVHPNGRWSTLLYQNRGFTCIRRIQHNNQTQVDVFGSEQIATALNNYDPRASEVLDDDHFCLYQPGGRKVVVMRASTTVVTLVRETTVNRRVNKIMRLSDTQALVDTTDGTDSLPYFKAYVMSSCPNKAVGQKPTEPTPTPTPKPPPVIVPGSAFAGRIFTNNYTEYLTRALGLARPPNSQPGDIWVVCRAIDTYKTIDIRNISGSVSYNNLATGRDLPPPQTYGFTDLTFGKSNWGTTWRVEYRIITGTEAPETEFKMSNGGGLISFAIRGATKMNVRFETATALSLIDVITPATYTSQLRPVQSKPTLHVVPYIGSTPDGRGLPEPVPVAGVGTPLQKVSTFSIPPLDQNNLSWLGTSRLPVGTNPDWALGAYSRAYLLGIDFTAE